MNIIRSRVTSCIGTHNVNLVQSHLGSSSLFLFVLGTSEATGSAGGDETDFATSGSVTTHGRGHTDVLMVTTTVGMLDGVHSNTTNLRPAVALDPVLVVGTASLQHGLVNTATTSNNANHGTVVGGEDLLGARGELHTGFLGVRVVGNNLGIVARGTGNTAAVSALLFQVADDGSLRQVTNGHDIANIHVSFLATVEELSSVHALSSKEDFLADPVGIWITEVHDC